MIKDTIEIYEGGSFGKEVFPMVAIVDKYICRTLNDKVKTLNLKC